MDDYDFTGVAAVFTAPGKKRTVILGDMTSNEMNSMIVGIDLLKRKLLATAESLVEPEAAEVEVMQDDGAQV